MFFIALDEWLLGRIEKLSHRFQMVFGIMCFSVAKFFFIVTIIDLVLWSVFCFLVNLLPLGFPIMLLIVGTLYSWLRILDCEKLKDRYSSLEGEDIGMNKLCITLQSDRVKGLVVTLIGLVALLLIFPSTEIFLFLAHLLSIYFFLGLAEYFISCTPLPPGKSKVKEWLESFKKAPKLAPALNPV